MTKYQAHNGIYLPTIEDIILYIDDGGLTDINFSGFGALLLDKSSHDLLNEELNELFDRKNVSELHASKIKRSNKSKYERIYENAFQLLCKTLRKTNHRYLVTLLGCSTNIGIISDDLDLLLTSNMTKIGNESIKDRYPKVFSHLLFPINNIFNRIPRCDDNIKIHTYIDRKYDFENIHNESFSMNGQLFDGDKTLCMITNTYLKNQLNNKCKIESLNIVKAINYPILQLVDGIINFAFNYIKVVVKDELNSSKTEIMKYNVFRGLLSEIGIDYEALKIMIKQEFNIVNGVVTYNTDKLFFSLELTPDDTNNVIN